MNGTHNDGLRRAWYWACKDEAINLRRPTRLPLPFALDGKLAIANGFHYVPDCRSLDDRFKVAGGATYAHCATSFADGSAAGDADGFGGARAQAVDGRRAMEALLWAAAVTKSVVMHRMVTALSASTRS